MKRDEVINYFYNINNHKTKVEFLKRWVEEVQEKEWRNEFMYFINNSIVMNVFRDMFIRHEIIVVEEIKTGRILKLI